MAVHPIGFKIVPETSFFPLEGKTKSKTEEPTEFKLISQSSSLTDYEIQKGSEWLSQDLSYTGKELLDDKLFAHIHGDSFISGSAHAAVLEGHNLASTLEHYTQFLQSLPSNYNSPQIDLAAQSLKKAQNLLWENQVFIAPSQLPHKTAIVERAKYLAKMVSELTDNPESPTKLKTPFTIPFGYTSNNGGHAMMLQIVDSELRVFNTGDGINYHLNKPMGGKIKYSPVLSFKDISLKSEDLERFFRGLLECLHPDPSDPLPLGEQPDADYIYQKLLPNLGGIAVNDSTMFHEEPKDFIMDQTAGVCAEKALHAFLRHHLPLENGEPVEYKRLQFLYKEETLKAYYQKYFAAPNSEPTELSLLLFQKALTKYALRLEKLHENNMLSQEEYRAGLAKHIALQQSLAKHVKNMRDAAENKRMSALQEAKAIPADIPAVESTKTSAAFSLKTPSVNDFKQIKNQQLQSHHFSFPRRPLANLDEAIDLISRMENYIQEANHLEQSGPIAEKVRKQKVVNFHTFVEYLEIPDPEGKRKTFWDDLDINQSSHKEIINRLSVLSQAAFDTEYSFCKQTSSPITQELIFIQAKLAAIMCHLARFQEPLMRKYQFKIGILDDYLSTPFAASLSLTQQEEWNKIIDCLAFKKDLPAVDLLKRINDNQGCFDNFDLNNKKIVDLQFIQELLGNRSSIDSNTVAKAYVDVDGVTVPNWFAQFHRQQFQLRFTLAASIEKSLPSMSSIYYTTANSKKWIFGPTLGLIEASGTTPFSEAISFFPLLCSASTFNPRLKYNRTFLEIFFRNFINCTNDYEGDNVSFVVAENDRKFIGTAAPIDVAKELGAALFNTKTRALEIIQFFNRYTHLLQEPAYQKTLELGLFSLNSLQSYLASDPRFANVLLAFICKGIDSSQKRKDLLGELFYLKLSHSLKPFIAELALKNADFPDALERCLALLKKSGMTDIEKRTAAFLLLHCANQLPPKTIENSATLAGAILSAKSIIWSTSRTEQDPCTSLELDILWNKLYPAVQSYLENHPEKASEVADAVLEALVHPDFKGRAQKQTWAFDKENEQFTSGGDRKKGWLIDLKTGSLFFEEAPYLACPREIEEDTSFKQVFGKRPYRISPEHSGLARVEYEIEEGKWGLAWVKYQYAQGIGTVFTCNIHKSFNNQQAVFLTEVPGPLRLVPSFLGANLHYWHSHEANKVFIVNQTDQIVATISLENNPHQEGEKQVVAVHDGDLRFVRDYRPLGKKLWWERDLTAFETPGWIELWMPNQAKDMVGAIVKLPRFGLDFEVRNSEQGLQLFCLQEPGFVLESSNYLSIDQQTRRVLLLKDIEKGNRKALLPYAEAKDNKIPLIEISLNKQGNFSPCSAEQHLFLAKLALESSEHPKRIEEVERQLRLAWSLHKPSPNSQKFLVEIAKMLIARKEASVAGVGLKLLCQYEQWRHQQPQTKAFSEADEKDLGELEDHQTKLLTPFLGLKSEEVANLFSLYLKRHRNDPLMALSREEQQQILDFASNSYIVRQLNSLQHPTPALPLTSGRKITPGFCNAQSSQVSWKAQIHKGFFENGYDQNQVLYSHRVTFLTKEEFYLSFKAFLELATSSDPHAREEVKKRLSLLRLPKKCQEALRLNDILLNAAEYPDQYRYLLSLLQNIDYNTNSDSKALAIDNFLSIAPRRATAITVNSGINPIENPPKIKLKKNDKKTETSLPIMWVQTSTFDAKPFLEFSSKEPLKSLEPLFDYSRLKLEDAEKVWLSDTEKDFVLREKQISKGHRVIENSLGVLKQSLEAAADVEKEQLDQLSDSLLTLINRSPDDQLKKIKRVLDAATGRYQKINSAEQLIFAYLKGSVGSWKALNEMLTEDECKFLDAEMSRYLQHATTLGRIQRQLSQIKDLETLYSRRGASPSIDLEIEEASEALAHDLNTPRVYGPHTDLSDSASRLCLAFEFLSDLTIRPKQIRIVQNILEGKIEDQEREFISQLIMGGGKSKVILPLLSLLLADGKKLAVLCIPKEQIDVQKEYLNQLSGGLFGKRAHTLAIERETKMDAHFVKMTWRLLNQIREKGEYLIVTPETLQALELKWHELRRSGELQDYKMRRQLAKIFDLFKQSGYLLLDEADRILDIRKELNFTEGASIALNQDICAQFAELYKLLAMEEDIGLMQNQQSARFDFVWPALQKRLAKAMAASLCERCQIEDHQAKEALAAYIINPKFSAPAFLKNVSLEERDRVGLMRAQLTIFLPLTLKKTGQKDYAFAKNPAVVSAIPASFCIPKERSRFGTPYEAVNYTLQLILQQGLTSEHLRQAAAKMQQEAIYLTEMNRPFESSSLVAAFQELLPEKNLLDPFTDDDYAWISEQLQANPEFALALAQMVLLPQIETFPYKATHNAHNLSSLFHKTFGFTGTPWNWGCWPKQLGQPDLDPGTDGLTLGVLMQKIQRQGKLGIQTATLPEYDGTDVSLKAKIETLLDLFVKKRPNSCYRAIIDLGAQFKGVHNRDIAQVLLDYFRKNLQNLTIKGVVFFEKDQMFVLLENGKIIPYAACELKPEELFTLYDNAHVIGADIPQEVFAEAIVTIGENLYLKDLLQAVGRMRGLRRLQSVSFFIPNAIVEIINLTCHQDKHTTLALKDIFHFAAINQSRIQMEDTYRAAKTEISALIRKTVVEKLHSLDKNRQFNEADQLFNAFDALDGIFRAKQPFSPWDDFCTPVDEISAEKSLLELRDRWIKDLEKISQAGKIEAAFIDGLLSAIRAWNPLNLSRMAKTIEHPDRSSADNCVEVLQERNTELNLKTELDLNLDLKVEDHNRDGAFRRFNNKYDPFHPEDSRGIIFHDLCAILTDPANLAKGRESIAKFAHLFQGPINVSQDLAHVYPEFHYSSKDQFFDEAKQKPFEHVLVRETGIPEKPLEFYLISQNDLAFFKDNLHRENDKSLEQQAKVWIYTIYNKDYGLKTNRAAPDKWLEQPSFLKEMAKIHLLSGFSYLTPKEEEAMKDLINQLPNPESISELIKSARDKKISDREKVIYAKMFTGQALTGVSPKLRTRLQRKIPVIIKPTESILPDGKPTVLIPQDTNGVSASTISTGPSEIKIDSVATLQSKVQSPGQSIKKSNRFQRFFHKIGQGFRNFGKWFARGWARMISAFKKLAVRKHIKKNSKVRAR